MSDALQQKLQAALDAQTEHPVYEPVHVDWSLPYDIHGAWAMVGGAWERVSLDRLVALIDGRERIIAMENNDWLRHQWEPPIWKEIDRQIAIKRLEHPGVQLELLVMGGIRSGKTNGACRRIMSHYLYTTSAWVWGLHETETTSKTQQQRDFYKFLPPELRTGKHKRDRETKFSYAEGAGFTENRFNIYWDARDEFHMEHKFGGLFDFRFYKSQDSTKQGAELTAATSDEMVPKETCDTVRERLLSRAQDTRRAKFLTRVQDALARLERGENLPPALLGALYHSVHIITFTPKEGYSVTVGDFLDGATTTSETAAELLPTTTTGSSGATTISFHMVPRFKQPKKAQRLIAYLHTYDNPFKGNWEGMKADCQGKMENEIRVLAYGDVRKTWNVRFHKWRDTVHLVDLAAIPTQGTWYEVTDPAPGRPWFTIWALVDPTQRVWIVREWPQEGTHVPGIGQVGEWAQPSKTGRRNGDKGPAQSSLGWDFRQFTHEFHRVRMELGSWWGRHTGKPPPAAKLQWEDRDDLTLDGTPIVPQVSLMDSRFGNTKMMGRTIIDSMDDEENAIGFLPSSGAHHDEGDVLIESALAFDETRAVDALNAPRLFVTRNCHAVQWMFQNYHVPEFSESTRATDEACKDPRDVVAYLLLEDPRYVDETRRRRVRGGFTY